MLDTSLNAGTYYIAIDGNGNLNSTNDYGSLGSYSIDGYYSGTTTTTTTTTSGSTKPRTGTKKSANTSIMAGSEQVSGVDSKFMVIKQAQLPVLVNAKIPYHYQVLDNTGRILMVGKADAGSRTFDVRNQPAGLYIIRLNGEGEQRTEQFLNH